MLYSILLQALETSEQLHTFWFRGKRNALLHWSEKIRPDPPKMV